MKPPALVAGEVDVSFYTSRPKIFLSPPKSFKLPV